VPLVWAPLTLPQILAPAEVDALTAALRRHRDRAMVAAMVLGGLRRCEVLGLRLGDLRFGERRLFVAEGKGGHQRLIPVSARFFTEVSAYLDAERPTDASTSTPDLPAVQALMTGSMMRQASSASSPRMNSMGLLLSMSRIRWA
jgi:site-specific recombinase XerD